MQVYQSEPRNVMKHDVVSSRHQVRRPIKRIGLVNRGFIIYDSGVLRTGITLPILTESTSSGLQFAACKAALHAAVWRTVDEVFLNEPPKVPNAVRFAPTMNIPEINDENFGSAIKILFA